MGSRGGVAYRSRASWWGARSGRVAVGRSAVTWVGWSVIKVPRVNAVATWPTSQTPASNRPTGSPCVVRVLWRPFTWRSLA